MKTCRTSLCQFEMVFSSDRFSYHNDDDVLRHITHVALFNVTSCRSAAVTLILPMLSQPGLKVTWHQILTYTCAKQSKSLCFHYIFAFRSCFIDPFQLWSRANSQVICQLRPYIISKIYWSSFSFGKVMQIICRGPFFMRHSVAILHTL